MNDTNKSSQNISTSEYKNSLICPKCFKSDVKLYGFSKDVVSKPYYIYLHCSCTKNCIIQYELSSYINNILNNDNDRNLRCEHQIENNEFYCESCNYKMCQQCQKYHTLNYPTHKCNLINDTQNFLSYCKIHKAHHTYYCKDCNITSCFQCYLNNHLMHNIVTKDKFFSLIKEIIPFKSIKKLNEYFEYELKESSNFYNDVINKLDLMINGLTNIKNSFIETRNNKYANESNKLVIANVIYKSFYNERNEASIISILNMENLVLNSLVFKDDKIHFRKIFNECFKSLVEIGKSFNSLINRTLVSFQKNNMVETKLISSGTNTNGASETNQIFTNEEILYNNSNFSEDKEKKSNLDNSSIKNSKLVSLLSRAKDSSMSEGFLSNENNKIIELNESSYIDDKNEESSKAKSLKSKHKKIKEKSKLNLFVIKKGNNDKINNNFDKKINIYINYKKNIEENKDHFVFDQKTIDAFLKNSITSEEYDNYLMKDDRKPNLIKGNKIGNFKLGDIRQNNLFQKRKKDNMSTVYNNNNKNNISNINNLIENNFNFFNHNLNESLEKDINSSFESNIYNLNNNKSFDFNNSFL